jgi:TP901 family phage tail tape measure protein
VSDFLAEAKVVVRPDTSRFRAELTEKLNLVTRGAAVAVPVTFVAAGGAAAAAASAAAATTAGLVAAQKTAGAAALGLTLDEDKLTRAYGAQAVILQSLSQRTAQLAGVQKGAAGASKGLLGAGTAAGKLDAALLGLRTAVGSAAVIGLSAISLGAIAAGKALRGMILATAQFEQELSTFRATTEATASQMAAVSEQALKLGADISLPAVSAADAAVAMTELARAGLTVEEAMAGAEGVLQLATAAQISNAEAAKLAANALNSFGLAGEQATEVADAFANAANAAQGSVTDIGIAFQQASAVARQVGLSLQDTTSILSLFAKNGLQGSDAGTSLRVALIRLVAPTKDARAEIQKLGLDIRDAQGNVRPDVFAQFGEATANLSPAARDASAALIFGQDAIRAVSIGAREGAEGLRIMQLEIAQTGTAAEVAAARTEGFTGAMEGLNSSLTTLGITLGGPINRTLTALAQGATTGTDAINRLTTAVGDLFAKVSNPPSQSRDFFGNLSQDVGDAISPVTRLRERFRDTIDVIDAGGLNATQRIRSLNKEIQALEAAAIGAEKGLAGPSPVTKELTGRIKELQAEIARLEMTGADLDRTLTSPIGRAIAKLEQVKAIRLGRGDVNTGGIQDLIDKLTLAAQEAGAATIKINGLPDGITRLEASTRGAAGGVDALTRALKQLGSQSAATQAELLRLQTEGGTPQQQIGVLQADIATQREIIAAAKKRGGPGTATAIEAARNQILSDQAKIDSLQSEIAAETKAAADAAKDKADEIAKNRLEATKSFLTAFDPAQQKILNQITTAGLTEWLGDDIKLQQALVAFLRNMVKQIQDRIKRLGLTGDALAAAKGAIKAANQFIFNVLNDIAQDEKAQQKRIQDLRDEQLATINQKLDFKIQIAQSQENIAKELRARRAKLAQITKELIAAKKEFGKNSVQWLELKAAQAEQIAAIKELEDQDKKKSGKSAQQFFFEQLQAQQGFAANLLGNLITGPTAGLVGVPSTPAAKAQATANAAQGKEGRGPTSGQAATTNDILLRIERQLRVLNGSQTAPEAGRQYKVGQAMMDGAGIPHGI